MPIHPQQLLLASTRLYASLPVVGRHLEPFAGLAAMALYGRHYAPAAVRAAISRRSGSADVTAAADSVEPLVEPGPVSATARRIPPFVRAGAQRRRCLYRSAIQYGSHRAQLLDVWRRPDLPPNAPVLLFVPGGAWVQGTRVLQGHTLLSHLVKQGWVCLTIDYRVSPVHRWPRHIADVNAAIAWARANIAQYGGDPRFVAVAGCSAGGHLASLAGLTPGDERFRGELADDADTSVDAVVSIYGRYDWEDRSTPTRRNFQGFLERVVVGRKQSRHPDVYSAASPLARIHADAPPFFLIHGTHDAIIPVHEARQFRAALESTSRNGVVYCEIPRAGHAFDLVDTSHARRCAVEVSNFLDEVKARRAESRSATAV
ncbi:alpha/beta hydrolase [Mycobacterium sp. 1274761.0]|uniref:alpha/beta hydrolase n=1 Tax=Mycobacterium sp. 1274761.0 TaxID=1834077 RepID=UPI0008021923|nr:alpha/beta hydrolase [Mycobacterium sp. 1274761.0]OBK71218.1 esterase [Mycobacterium sp. 1274761.0]